MTLQQKNVILPKTLITGQLSASPIIFLAGPIRGAPDWHSQAIRIISTKAPTVLIASPRTYHGDSPEFADQIISGEQRLFDRQREWERYYLTCAGMMGAVMFWLPSQADPYYQKVYSAMTRIELGQWMTNYRHDNSVRVCFGTDGGFPDMETIRYDLAMDVPGRRINGTLEETCTEAIRLATMLRRR